MVTVVDHDEAWPARFEVMATNVRSALGARAGLVEHIGSTAVPGLAAKPIIDMLLTVDDVTDEASYVSPLEPFGFGLRVREPDHRMLRTAERDVHLHVYEGDRPEVRDYLDLRDWLCEDANDRSLYAATKRHLAGREWSDMNYYADAKDQVVAELLTRARAWRAGQRASSSGGRSRHPTVHQRITRRAAPGEVERAMAAVILKRWR
ncbi:MAG: GrpB family protein [Actinomycetota bacterium]|nr:GrpB family protein [Actinomycetota bacterium]